MGVKAGNLRERVELQRAVMEIQSNGEQLQRWVTYATPRAQVLQQRSSRAFSNGEQWYPTARTLVMRIPPKVKGGDRVLLRGEVYVALPPKLFPREGYQEIDCELYNE